jgi:ribulose-5-phosphate 4-epimerase/fuculose-1-phosphate aldolase
MEHGRDLARTLADNPVVLMRGHGCAVAANSIQESVLVSIYAQVNARLLLQALPLGNVKYIRPGEIAKRDESDRLNTVRHTRTWEYYRRRAGCESL